MQYQDPGPVVVVVVAVVVVVVVDDDVVLPTDIDIADGLVKTEHQQQKQ